jgi:hypothetical protein
MGLSQSLQGFEATLANGGSSVPGRQWGPGVWPWPSAQDKILGLYLSVEPVAALWPCLVPSKAWQHAQRWIRGSGGQKFQGS